MASLAMAPPLAPEFRVLSPALTLRVPGLGAALRVQVSRPSLASAATALGVARLPTEPGRTCGEDPIAWWLAPNGWLVTAESAAADVLAASLRDALASTTHAIVDVSDALVPIRLDGGDARALLLRGTGAEPGRPGTCLRTRFAQLPVLLRPLETGGFELLVERGAAAYLRDWIIDAAAGI